MKRPIVYFLFLILILLAACKPAGSDGTPIYSWENLVGSGTPDALAETQSALTNPTEIANTPMPTENPFATMYGCEMKMEFNSGPLDSKTVDFEVLGEDYFLDKGDKFDPGKGTSIYYQSQHYFILHSSFVNGNILRPMEAEFIRKYLEYWGESGSQYVQGQIDSLIGSEVTWICNGETVFRTKIDSIARLSYVAAQDLWMNPETLDQILINKEGSESEWIGEILPTSEPHLYVGFCGWGPESLESLRYTYYRYIIRFTIQ